MTEQGPEPQEQGETETVTPTDTPPANAFGLPDDHPAMKELSRVRREAAGRREEKNKVEQTLAEKAKKWEEYEESRKTELQKAEEKAKALESELEELRTEKTRQKIADEFELDADLRALLVGDEKQMKAMAKILSEKFEAANPNADSFLGGARGKPVTKDGNSGDPGKDFLKSFI